MSKKISVVISSLRPERLEETIDSTAMHSDLVEIVVCSPLPPKPRDFVRHVPVPGPSDPNELSWSQKNNLAVKEASGEYIVFNNDDIHFRAGWAPELILHMEKTRDDRRPYLAAFHLANKGIPHTRYTAFGMLYANLGCICKADLIFVGGTLFDERFWLSHNDVDLGLRVWHAGGKVELCKNIVMDIDRDKPHKVTSPYHKKYFYGDCETFFMVWFPRYFWKFVKNYHSILRSLTSEDNVLPPHQQVSGAFRVLISPFIVLKVLHFIGMKKNRRTQNLLLRLTRVVNRRWATMDYQVPYMEMQ